MDNGAKIRLPGNSRRAEVRPVTVGREAGVSHKTGGVHPMRDWRPCPGGDAWLALAVWAVVFLAMAGTLLRSARLPDPSAPASQ